MPIALKDSWLAALVFLAALLLTLTATYAVSQNINAQRKSQFDAYVDQMEQAIERRTQIYTNVLIGARGLFSVEKELSVVEWRRYVENLDLRERYPGIQGIGYATFKRMDELPALEARMRREGFATYAVKPAGPRAEYYPIQFLEPLDARNRAAIGYDMYADPVRRLAMAAARDTGLPITSGKVTLVQEITRDKQTGFLIYVPVYRLDSRPDTLLERRAAIRGFVYSPFRTGDLFSGIFGEEVIAQLDYAVYDGPPLPENLLFADAHGHRPDAPVRFERVVSVEVPGRDWTLVVKAPPQFRFETADALPAIVFGGGLFVSLLLFSNTWALASSRRRALALAEQMTTELRDVNAQLQEVDRSKDEFLSVISHELRTPLNFIMGFASVLEDEIAGPLNPEQHRYVGKITEGSERMLMLVNDLLDIAKLQAGKFDLAPEPIDYPALLHGAIAAMKPLADEKRQAIDAAIESPLPLVGDPQRVVQVLSNLLSNAIKFTEPGGHITVRAFQEDGWVVTEVSDTGIGIGEADLPKLFTRFKQLDMSATRKAGGTGLGLAICKALIEAQGGSIGVRSQPGKGSTFWFALPERPEGADESRDATVPS